MKMSIGIPVFRKKFMNEFSDENTKILKKAETIFSKYLRNDFLLQLVHSEYINDIPAVTYYFIKEDELNKQLGGELKGLNLPDVLLTSEDLILPVPTAIPPYNLLHIGSVCHFNSCINILCSLTHLLDKMFVLCFKDGGKDKSFELLTEYCAMAYSKVDINPKILVKLMMSLGINVSTIGEGCDTMKVIMRCLYKNGITIHDVFFWDCSDEFYKKDDMKMGFGQRLIEVNPRYLLMNVHDFNIVNEVDSYLIPAFNFKAGMLPVSLKSIMVYQPGHYFTAFFTSPTNTHVKILNDINRRYDEEIVETAEIFNPFLQHTLACCVVG